MESGEPKDGQPWGIVPGHRVRLAPERARVHVPSHKNPEPQITLIREGDVVKAIEVLCTCGQRIRLNCVF